MSFYVVIPARYASTRLPGKPLLTIAGKPMVQHVYERAQLSGAHTVVVATDDARIQAAVEAFGGHAVMTSAAHESGTDRLQEVAATLGAAASDVMVNVQGDEPLISPRAIDQVATNLLTHPAASVATLCEPLASAADLRNPNFVKVVTDVQGYALYFSRAPIPWDRDHFNDGVNALAAGAPYFRHIGLYAYRASLLHQFVQWPSGQLERLEKLEQLRVLENSHRIHVALSCEPFAAGVDTPEDLERVEQALQRP